MFKKELLIPQRENKDLQASISYEPILLSHETRLKIKP